MEADPEIVLTAYYLEAMERHGLSENAQVLHAAYSDEGGFKAGMTLLTGEHRPSAVMTGADVAALGIYRAAHELGLRIPEDLSLVGYNNTALAALAPVQLTSVDQAGHTMGSSAARMLIERVEGRRDRAMQTTMTPASCNAKAPQPRGAVEPWPGRRPRRLPARPKHRNAG